MVPGSLRHVSSTFRICLVFGWEGKHEGVSVRNPAFDVTPAELITVIICEKGVAPPP
jgi:translation initiation factor 2B subunit (eIF-2B alpha/beta/delta family)